jgi:hypothetical protein
MTMFTTGAFGMFCGRDVGFGPGISVPSFGVLISFYSVVKGRFRGPFWLFFGVMLSISVCPGKPAVYFYLITLFIKSQPV